jgi:hypothetical protein
LAQSSMAPPGQLLGPSLQVFVAMICRCLRRKRVGHYFNVLLNCAGK